MHQRKILAPADGAALAVLAVAALCALCAVCVGVVLWPLASGPRTHSAAVTLTVGAGSIHQPADTGSEDEPPGLHPLDDPEQEHRLRLRSGGDLVGVLLERTEDRVVARVDGSELRLSRREVVGIEPLPPLSERYRERRSNISDTDARALVAVAGWLRRRGAYRTALRDANAALEADPFNRAASDLVRWLEAQIALLESAKERKRNAAAASGAGDGTDEPDPAEAARRRRAERLREIRREGFPTLTQEQINLMRVWEIDLDNPPRLVVPDDVLDRLLKEYAEHPLVPKTEEGRRQLRRAPAARALDLMFRLRAEEFYGQVRVLDHPESIRLFREHVHERLVTACASNECHGGQEAGRLWLRRDRINSDATVYTNLYILDRYRLEDGTPLINYDKPDESALLHMATLRGNSRRPHPEVGLGVGRGYRPLYRSPNEPDFREAVDWIDAMYRPRPDYNIDYDAPVSASARRAARAPDGRSEGREGGGDEPPTGEPAGGGRAGGRPD